MSEETTEMPHSPTSPTDRRRKRSIIFNDHPQIMQFDDSVDSADTNDNETDSAEDQPSESYNTPLNDTLDDPNVSEQDNNASGTNTTRCTDSHDDGNQEPKEIHVAEPFDSEKSLNVSEVSASDNNVPQPPANDIVYDETKPRRLPNPKKLHLNIQDKSTRTLQDSISYLISPEEPENESPGRRRRRKQNESITNTKSEPNFRLAIEQEEPSRRVSETTRVMLNGNHYQRSPDMSRRKLSHGASPVKKLIEKSSPLTTNRSTPNAVRMLAPSTAHRMKRKISSDARIGFAHDKLQVGTSPRSRKYSLDARLVGHAFERDEQEDIPSIDDIRKRKVSFDTTALVNGNRVMPLNDEVFIPEISEGPYHDHATDLSQREYGSLEEDARDVSAPKFYMTLENEDSYGSSTRLYSNENGIPEQYYDNDTDSVGFDNRAYTADDEDSVSSYNQSSPQYHTCNERQHATPSRETNDQPAVIPHTNLTHEPTRNGKKVSAASLPAGLGYQGQSPEDGTGPKSILKRRDDTESMISQESVTDRKFNVRKDSIALFTSQSGQIALQQIRQDHESQWKRFSGSRFKNMWSNRHEIFAKYKLHILVLVLFTLTFTFVVVGLHLHSVHHKGLAVAKKIFFDAKSRRLSLHDEADADTFKGILGKNIPSWKSPTHCFQNYKDIHDKTCLKWKGHAQLDIAFYKQKTLHCYNVSWTMPQNTAPLDCFDLGGGYWYGPVNTTESVWPISKAKFSFSVSSAKHYGSGTFSSAAEYYWISSSGWALFFDSNYPMEISWNKQSHGQVCVHGIQSGDFYSLRPKPLSEFAYTLCNGINIKDTHLVMRERYFTNAIEIPDQSLLAYPHWSAVSESNSFGLNSSAVSQLAKSVQDTKIKCGTLEIDGKWESIYGDLTFNNVSFENITALISKVRAYDCDISLNIYPYFSYKSSNFDEGVSRSYFVMNVGKSVPALLKWEHGVGAMLDVSNSKARDWFAEKIYDIISKYKIETFRLSYGKLAWLPCNPQFNVDEMNPNKVKRLFTDLISSLGNAVLQSTSQSQHLSSIIGVQSTVIKNGGITCIRNIIPDIINYGLMGYPFLMADGISVDRTHIETGETIPSRDVFIRWMQLSTFLPAMKYTVKPWDYDDEVVSAARNISIFHENVVLEAIHDEREDIRNGTPIIRPLWWEEPREAMSFKVDDEFMLTSRFLVAPILCESGNEDGNAERDIFLPKGVWKDMVSDDNKIIIGPRKLKRFKVSQYQIPYFEKMPEYDEY